MFLQPLDANLYSTEFFSNKRLNTESADDEALARTAQLLQQIIIIINVQIIVFCRTKRSNQPEVLLKYTNSVKYQVAHVLRILPGTFTVISRLLSEPEYKLHPLHLRTPRTYTHTAIHRQT